MRTGLFLVVLLILPALVFGLAVAPADAAGPLPQATPAATPAPAAVPTPAPLSTLDPQALARELTRDFIVVLLITAFCGGLGGLVYELLMSQGRVELPHTDPEARFFSDWGVGGRVFIGAAAAIVAIFFIVPQDAMRLVAISIIAGSTGSAIFKTIQVRVEAMLNQQQLFETENKLRQAGELASQVKAALSKPAAGKPSRGIGETAAGESTEIMEKLAGIETLSQSVRRPQPPARK